MEFFVMKIGENNEEIVKINEKGEKTYMNV